MPSDAHELAHTGCQPRKACHADHAVAGRDRSVTVLEEKRARESSSNRKEGTAKAREGEGERERGTGTVTGRGSLHKA